MNSHGLNSAALNGSAVRMIAGAALLAVAFTASATPTRTTQSAALVSMGSSISATGVRKAMGQADIVAKMTGIIGGVIATDASAVISTSMAVRASYTEAYAPIGINGTAAGTIIRPGAATASSTFALDVTPKVTLGYASNINYGFTVSADPSVKRSGESTWQRDGYATAASQFILTADSLRTARAAAMASVTSSATAEALLTQGGVANIVTSWTVEATGSIDFAQANFSMTMSALPTVTQYAGALIDSAIGITALPTNTQPGAAKEVTFTTSMQADARLALLGEAAITVNSGMRAEARLAWLSFAQIDLSASVSADGTNTRPGGAQVDVGTTMAAQWQILRFGEASIDVRLPMTAAAITNPSVAAPSERAVLVPADDRAMNVSAETRTMEVT